MHTFVSWHSTMSARHKLWQLWCTSPLYNYHDVTLWAGVTISTPSMSNNHGDANATIARWSFIAMESLGGWLW